MTIRLTKYFVVILVFIIIPYFIDQVDGFVNLVLNKGWPIAKLYKTPLLLYAIGYVFIYDKTKKYALALLLCLFLFVAATLVNVYDLYPEAGTLSSDLGYLLKIFAFPILYFYFSVFHTYNPFPDYAFIKKVFLFLFFAFSMAIIASYFGFGLSFYGETEDGESIGQQGYFSAGNEISGFLILLVSLFYFYAFRTVNVVYMFTSLGLVVGVCLLMGSKTAMLTSIICFFSVYALIKIYERKTLFINKLDASLIVTFTASIIIGIIFISQIAEIIQPITGRLVYRYRLSGDVVRFLTSGRLYRAEAVMNNYTENFSFAHMLFGQGYEYSKTLKIPNVRYSKAEMDFPDILCICGIVGVSMIYSFWIYIWTKIFLLFTRRKNQLSIPLLITLTILIINSNISGHIIYSSIINPSLAYLSVFVLKGYYDPRLPTVRQG